MNVLNTFNFLSDFHPPVNSLPWSGLLVLSVFLLSNSQGGFAADPMTTKLSESVARGFVQGSSKELHDQASLQACLH